MWHFATASLTPSRGGSSIATKPQNVNSVKGKFVIGSCPLGLGCSLSSFAISNSYPFWYLDESNLLYAKPITRSPFKAKTWFAWANLFRKFWVIGTSFPFNK